MAAQAKRHEFRVVIEGADLPKEAVAHINQAVQQAATQAMASIDLKGDWHDWHIHIPPWNWGIWYRPLSKAELEKAGIQVPRELFPEK
jgi:hypothetical protein